MDEPDKFSARGGRNRGFSTPLLLSEFEIRAIKFCGGFGSRTPIRDPVFGLQDWIPAFAGTSLDAGPASSPGQAYAARTTGQPG
jgi:hypothetical protein